MMKKRNIWHILLGGLLGCTSCQSGTQVIQTVDATQFQKLIQSESSIQLLDVRTPDEYQAGHIPGATLINVQDSDFSQKAKEQLQKDQGVAVYCRSGMRSMRAAKQLEKQGFSKIYNLDGGIQAWTSHNYPTEK